MVEPQNGNVNTDLKTTPLDGLHRKLGARMAGFAGYDMPIQFAGVMAEHQATREAAGLFDVSHMGQVMLTGDGADEALERIVVGNITALKEGRIRYTLFTNQAGGILDDLMVTRFEDGLFLVVNAGCKEADIAHLRTHLEPDIKVDVWDGRALIALQGPKAAEVLARLAPGVEEQIFMSAARLDIAGIPAIVSRCGYTGEDGFEISVGEAHGQNLAERLLSFDEVSPVGLGARDSLRLEAGLCLYGHDIDETTTPVEADLSWAFGKRRREEGGFPGADIILKQLADGPSRLRVGIRPDGRAPAREGTPVLNAEGRAIGTITSGGFGPTVGGPVAMGYVETAFAAPDTEIGLEVRGKSLPAKVVTLPFVPHNYRR